MHRSIENPMLIDALWKYLDETDLENVVNQQECCGIDYYGTEILEGDEVVVDAGNFYEEILRENLIRYLVERCFFIYDDGIYVDVDNKKVIKEESIETYLNDIHGFEFRTAN